jgi:hypothetical protein
MNKNIRVEGITSWKTDRTPFRRFERTCRRFWKRPYRGMELVPTELYQKIIDVRNGLRIIERQIQVGNRKCSM